MNTLKSYIHEGLFSSDSIDNQIDKSVESAIINNFRSIYYKYDRYLKKLETAYAYRYDLKDNTLYISSKDKKSIYFNTNLIDEFDFNICFEGEVIEFVAFLNNKRMRTDKIFNEKVNNLFKNITIHNFGFETNIFKNDYEIEELNLNLGKKYPFKCRIDFFTKGDIIDFKNLNITMKDQCDLIMELMTIDSINNINFSNKSAKCSNLIMNIYNPKNIKLLDKHINQLKEINKIFSEIEIRFYKSGEEYIQDNCSGIAIFNKNEIIYK